MKKRCLILISLVSMAFTICAAAQGPIVPIDPNPAPGGCLTHYKSGGGVDYCESNGCTSSIGSYCTSQGLTYCWCHPAD